MTNEQNPTPEAREPSDETQHLPADGAAPLPTEGDVTPPRASTEQLPAVDPTAEIPTSSSQPVEEGAAWTSAEPVEGSAGWTHADRTESELRADATETAEAAAMPAIPAVPVAAAGGGAGGLPPRPGFWHRVGDAWRRVWSRTWGKVAVIAIAGLAVLALVSAIGLAAFAGGRDRGEGRMAGGRDGWIACAQGQRGDGMGQGKSQGNGRGKDKGKARDNCAHDDRGQGANGFDGDQMMPNGKGMPGNGMGNGRGLPGNGIPGKGMGNGTGRGGMTPGNGTGQGMGGQALANALHGELVLGGLSPRTVLFQVGQITEFTAGQSLVVKSSDGFTATYALTADTAGPATGVQVGATVRVIADKDGAKATRVQLLDAAVATG